MTRPADSRRARRRVAGAACIALMLAACAGHKPRPESAAALAMQQSREAELQQRQEWGFSGRIAVSGGGESGSGRVDWHRRGPRLEVSMQAPVSRQSWRLLDGPDGARLEGLEGGTRFASDAETLLRQELGWELPLIDVEAWVRGLRSSAGARLEFDAQGMPQRLRDGGWEVEYRGWTPDATPMPLRVFGQSGSERFRLVVDRWHPPAR